MTTARDRRSAQLPPALLRPALLPPSPLPPRLLRPALIVAVLLVAVLLALSTWLAPAALAAGQLPAPAPSDVPAADQGPAPDVPAPTASPAPTANPAPTASPAPAPPGPPPPAPGAPAAGATAAYTVAVPVPGGTQRRSYQLRTPERGAGPRPLLVVLHGRYQSPTSVLALSGAGPVAGQRGFVVAAPAAVGGGWNAGTCCSTGVEQRVADVAFLDQLVDDVARRTPVDRQRVFVTGFSNGGMMAYRYACERPRQVAGIAVVAGGQAATADYGGGRPQQCRPARPVALLHVHGSLDRVVPYAGGVVAGSAGRVAPVRAGVQRFADAAGCGAPAATRSGRSTHLVHGGCRPGAAVRLVKVDGLGHGWTRDARRFGYDTTVGVLDFFGRLPRR